MKISKCCHRKVINHHYLGNVCTECLMSRVDVVSSYKNLILFCAFCVIMAFTVVAESPTPNNNRYEKWWSDDTVETYVPKDIELNDSSILQELINNGCVLPNVAMAQSKIETAYYTSPICLENKNLFGIKHNKHGFSIGTNRGHAKYNTYKDNIKDYVRIQNMYLKKINGKYVEDENYIPKLKTIK